MLAFRLYFAITQRRFRYPGWLQEEKMLDQNGLTIIFLLNKHIVYLISSAKLIIVEGEGEQLLEKFKVQKTIPFFHASVGFQCVHAMSRHKQTAYGQAAEH